MSGVNKEKRIKLKELRIGETKLNNQGDVMTIVNYKNCHDIDVEFQDEYKLKINSTYQSFINGTIKNPYSKRFRVGYMGYGNYFSSINGVLTPQYITWQSMLKRCYSKEYQIKQPTYVDCLVCDEWLNFQNFAKWFDENYYEIDNERMELDKDILTKGNKIYSPDNCIFVSQKINSMFMKKYNNKSNLLIGVYTKGKRFRSCMKKLGDSNNYLGTFDTPQEAFQAYKVAKEQYIKQVADEYKNKIPDKLYNAMYCYQVDITD